MVLLTLHNTLTLYIKVNYIYIRVSVTIVSSD